jgi:CspA family cold shock protein
MKQASVKWFDDAKGYGFLTLDGQASDVFVHYSTIQADGRRTLLEGQRVEFEMCEGPRGLFAQKVSVLECDCVKAGVK